jgi:hypothetical protein
MTKERGYHRAIIYKKGDDTTTTIIGVYVESGMPLRVSPPNFVAEIVWCQDEADKATFLQAIIHHSWNALPEIYFCLI